MRTVFRIKYPDDPDLIRAATDFATNHDDDSLKEQIAKSTKVYGATASS